MRTIINHLSLLPTPKPTNITTSALRTVGELSRTSRRGAHGSISVPAGRTAVRALVILSTAFGPVDTLFRGHVSDGLGEAAFAYLAADEVVDAVLEVVDLAYACDFGFVEFA